MHGPGTGRQPQWPPALTGLVYRRAWYAMCAAVAFIRAGASWADASPGTFWLPALARTAGQPPETRSPRTRQDSDHARQAPAAAGFPGFDLRRLTVTWPERASAVLPQPAAGG